MFPVREVHFTLYLQYMGETVKLKSAVQEAVNGIGWVHPLSAIGWVHHRLRAPALGHRFGAS